MRFEVAAAYVMGIGLPALEVLRRRTNFSTISGYVDWKQAHSLPMPVDFYREALW